MYITQPIVNAQRKATTLNTRSYHCSITAVHDNTTMRNSRSLPLTEKAYFPHFVAKGIQLDVGSNTSNVYSSETKWDTSNLGLDFDSRKRKVCLATTELVTLNEPSEAVRESDDETNDNRRAELEFGHSAPWDIQLPRVQSTDAKDLKDDIEHLHASFYDSSKNSRSVSSLEFIPGAKETNELNAEKCQFVGNFPSDIHKYCVLGYIQTTAGLRANRDSKLVTCYSSGTNFSVFNMRYQDRSVLTFDCRFKIIKIVIPEMSQITSTYSDLIGLVLENGEVVVFKIAGLIFEDLSFSTTSIPKSEFQGNALVDIAFSTYDRNELAITDSVGNWICVLIKQKGTTLTSVKLKSQGGNIFDPEELDSDWRRILWGKNYDSLLLFDKSKIVAVNTKDASICIQNAELKTWSSICDVQKVNDYVICLTSKEILILEATSSGILSRKISWKHHFENYQRLHMSCVLAGEQQLIVSVHSQEYPVILLYQFFRSSNDEFKAAGSPTYIKFGSLIDFHDIYIQDPEEPGSGSDESEEPTGTVLRLLYKPRKQRSVLFVSLDLSQNQNYTVLRNEKQIAENTLKVPSKAMENVLMTANTLSRSKRGASNSNVDDILQYQNYGSRINERARSMKSLPAVKSFDSLHRLDSDITDMEELLSFILQLREHLSSEYAVTDVESLLLSQVFQEKRDSQLNSLIGELAVLDKGCLEEFIPMFKEVSLRMAAIVNLEVLEESNINDVGEMGEDFQNVLSQWPSGEAASAFETGSTETAPWSVNSSVSRFQSQQQLPDISLSQGSSRKSKKRQPQASQLSQFSQPSSQFSQFSQFNASQSSLPSTMQPVFSLTGSQQNDTSVLSQRSRSQPAKKKKKRAGGFF